MEKKIIISEGLKSNANLSSIIELAKKENKSCFLSKFNVTLKKIGNTLILM
jgi:hypothetical protein